MSTSLLSLRGQIREIQAQHEVLSAQVAQQQLENQQLESALEHRDDPDVLESVARERGYVKSGEELYVDIAH